MKKTTLANILLASFLVILGNCTKNPDIDIESFEITNEKVIVQTNSAVVSGSYSFSGDIKGITVIVSENESLNQGKSFEATLENNAFSAEISELQQATTYYYQCSIDFGLSKPYYTEKKSFTTLGNAPTVTILETITQDSVNFRIKCEVTGNGGYEITERGVCWNTHGDPDLDDETIQHHEGGVGQYTIQMNNLALETKYYVRAYAKNSAGIGYSETKEFTTGTEAPETTTPTVSTIELNSITHHSVVCVGEVLSDGGLPLSERGVCWGIEPDPTINVNVVIADGIETGFYTVVIDGLAPNTTYHLRCYAINENGISYGEDMSFITEIGAPSVITTEITDISAVSAKCGGNVTEEGASSVTERGICWSTEDNPTIDGNHEQNGFGMGEFEVTINNLSPGTDYYVRAYAINAQDIAYGAVKLFTTDFKLPSVTTIEVTNLTHESAFVEGEVTDDGGTPVTERGFCWNTSPNPTIAHHHISCGSGMGNFSTTINGLAPSTTYYVKAYAKNIKGVKYGSEKSFTTLSIGGNAPEGAINGLFSVGPNSQVYFSKGNLQYYGSTNTWRFAEKQWKVIGDNQNNRVRDLFGWGTSGFNHNEHCWQPWSTSQNTNDYHAYGEPNMNLFDSDGKADWGYNQIQNGGNQLNMGWRTLTTEEWSYVLNERYTSSGIRFAKAIVNDTTGLILLPDYWNPNNYTLNDFNLSNPDFSTNTITESDWYTFFEENGAVFLPTSGSRNGTNPVNGIGIWGHYWSASYSNDREAYHLFFNQNNIFPERTGDRYFGYAVRLVIGL